MVELQPSKLVVRVRFPSPALLRGKSFSGVGLILLPRLEARIVVEAREHPAEQAQTRLSAPAIRIAVARQKPSGLPCSGHHGEDQAGSRARATARASSCREARFASFGRQGEAWAVPHRVALASGNSKGGPKPDVSMISAPYGGTMSEALERSSGKNGSVTVESAVRSVDVEVETIRHWSHVGSLEIEQRGDMDVVRLDRVILTDTSKVGARGARHVCGGLS
jgi:hypothetical protein